MTDIAPITVRLPKWRIRASKAILYILAPILTEKRGGELAGVLAGWMARGLKVE